MGQLYKNEKLDLLETKFNNYFSLTDIYNYKKVLIINSNELEEVMSKENINDYYELKEEPIFTLIKKITLSNNLYINNDNEMLHIEDIIGTIKDYKNTIIINITMLKYLNELNFLNEELSLNEKEYITLDNYGNFAKIKL